MSKCQITYPLSPFCNNHPLIWYYLTIILCSFFFCKSSWKYFRSVSLLQKWRKLLAAINAAFIFTQFTVIFRNVIRARIGLYPFLPMDDWIRIWIPIISLLEISSSRWTSNSYNFLCSWDLFINHQLHFYVINLFPFFQLSLRSFLHYCWYSLLFWIGEKEMKNVFFEALQTWGLWIALSQKRLVYAFYTQTQNMDGLQQYHLMSQWYNILEIS